MSLSRLTTCLAAALLVFVSVLPACGESSSGGSTSAGGSNAGGGDAVTHTCTPACGEGNYCDIIHGDGTTAKCSPLPANCDVAAKGCACFELDSPCDCSKGSDGIYTTECFYGAN